MADKSGSFSRWASRRLPSDVKNFANWTYSEATSHPISRIGTALKTGSLPPVEQKDIFMTGGGKVAPVGKRNVKVPSMLQSRYWRPGRSK